MPYRWHSSGRMDPEVAGDKLGRSTGDGKDEVGNDLMRPPLWHIAGNPLRIKADMARRMESRLGMAHPKELGFRVALHWYASLLKLVGRTGDS